MAFSVNLVIPVSSPLYPDKCGTWVDIVPAKKYPAVHTVDAPEYRLLVLTALQLQPVPLDSLSLFPEGWGVSSRLEYFQRHLCIYSKVFWQSGFVHIPPPDLIRPVTITSHAVIVDKHAHLPVPK